jgi:hypothetical protein
VLEDLKSRTFGHSIHKSKNQRRAIIELYPVLGIATVEASTANCTCFTNAMQAARSSQAKSAKLKAPAVIAPRIVAGSGRDTLNCCIFTFQLGH